MPAATIAQLIIALAPQGIQLAVTAINSLSAVWNKPTLTDAEVAAVLGPLLNMTADKYLDWAKAQLGKTA